MSLKHGKPNPLNYFGMRRVMFTPPHFKHTVIYRFSPIFAENLNLWIYENLNGRYYVVQNLSLDNSNSIVYTTKVGFESEKELSFFTIACPYLNLR